MALPKGYEMLQMASFAMGAINKRASFQADVRDHYTRIDTANRQAALNNQLAYNSYLHINEEQMLTTVKRAFDVAAIYKKIRVIIYMIKFFFKQYIYCFFIKIF